jgi:hypothetical protein
MPDDMLFIQSLTSDHRCAGEDIEKLVKSGWLRRLVVGTKPYLALGPNAQSYDTRSHDLPTRPQGDESFRQRILIDAEAERIVLYRVAIVVQLVVTLILIRSWLVYLLLP